MTASRLVPVAALLALGGCAYDGATGYAPQGYPDGYDSGMGSGLMQQPGDRFGAQNVTSIDVFNAPLAPYGQWVNSKYGRAFRPDVPDDWRPYVNGRWGENRLWVSDDPWGWATDHYGRWGFDDRAGWVWVPGTEWAPSWVAWREDEGQNVSGWAPVPPGVNYSLSTGFSGGFGYDSYASWYAPSWVWVPQSYLYQPGFGGRVLPWNYGANYWRGSRWQYQPGFGGRPAMHYRPQTGANWQGGYPQNRPGYEGGYNQQRPPQGGNWQGRPLQGNYGQPRPQQDSVYERSDGGRRGISAADGAAMGIPRASADRPTAAPRAEQAPQPRPQYVDRPAPPPRTERPEQQQAQAARRNDEGNTRPD